MTSNVGFFNGRLGIAKSDPKVSVYINTQDAIKLPCGFTSQRPAGLNVEPGMMRYNTTTGKFEGYSGESGSEAWGSLGDGSGGGGGGSGTTSGATGETTLQGQTLDSVDPNMSQLMTNQASVVGGGDFEVMGSGTHANLDIIAPAGSANLNLKVGTAASTGATIGWNNTVIDFNKKVKINGDLTLTGNLLESDGVTPRIFSNWTVATNPNDIYRGSGYVGIGTPNPQTRLHVNKDGQTMILEGATSTSGYCYMGLYPNGFSAGEKAFIGYPYAGWTSLVINNKNNQPIQFWTNNTEKMRLDKDGNLDVNGSIKSSVFLKLDNGYSLIWGEGKSKIAGFGGSTGNITFQTNSLTRMKIDSAGNVGIGTTTPYAQLEVTQSVNNKSHIRIGDGNHNGYASPSIYPALTYYARKDAVRRNTDPLFSGVGDTGGCTAAICFTDRPGTYTYASAVRTSDITFYTALNTIDNTVLGYYPRERMRITAEGNVGIGTTVPSQLLHLFNSSTAWNVYANIRLSTDNNNGNSYYGEIGYFRGTNGNITDEGLVFSGRDASRKDMVILSSNGNVGIGTTTPGFPLHVAGSEAGSNGIYLRDTWALSRIDLNLIAIFWATDFGTRPVGLRVDAAVWPESVLISSDERIKENIVDVSDNLALEMLRNIPVKYYEYKDKLNKGMGKTIGFIAQEVKEHLPMAVGIQTNVIPNEMRILTDISWNDTTLYTDLSDCSGIKYRFYVSNDISGNYLVKKEVIGNSDNSFTFDQSWNHVFCYGREVDDFHTLDKQKLFALNFSATQELDRQQQADKVEIAELKAKNTEMEAKNTEMEAKIAELEAKNITLENELKEMKTMLNALKSHLGL